MSFRIKRKETDADNSSIGTNTSTNDSTGTKRKRNHTLTRLFKRSSTSNAGQIRQKDSNPNLSSTSLTSQSMRNINSKKSLDGSQLSMRDSNGMSKSKSFPEQLSSNNRNSMIDLSKSPILPDVSPIREQRSKLQELDAVRKKLTGDKLLSTHNSLKKKDKSGISYKYDDLEEEEDINDRKNNQYSNYYSDDEDDDLSTNLTRHNDETDTVDIDHENEDNDENHHHHKKFLKNPHLLSKTLSHTRLSKSSLRLQSSTPNHSDSSINKGTENITSESKQNNNNEHTGIFSTLLNSINLKSFTDLTNHVHEAEDVESVHSEESASSQKSSNEALNAVNFKPVKKALITTLGEGNLTLDSFPKNETRLLSDIDDNKISMNRNITLEPPSNVSTIVATTSSTPSLDEIDRAINNTNTKSQSITRKFRSKSSLSPLPRKQTLRNSLTSILSTEDDIYDGNDVNEIPMSNSMSFKKKLKLPLTSKRLSLDNSLSRFTTNNDESSHAKKKDQLFEKLNVKIPNEKRQEVFRSLFSNLPSDERLIEDFTCAYRKDILVQGKLYLSESHICFHSNIIGLVTRFTIPLNAILKIQKKKTVGIPNAIEFSNLHNKYVFASFLSRDPTYDLIYKVWKSNINNNGLDTIDLDLDDDVDSLESVSTASSEDEDVTINQKVKDTNKSNNSNNAYVDTSDTSVSDQENMVKDDDVTADNEENEESNEQLFNGLPFEGPKTHAPTSNGYTPESSDIKIIDDIIKAPLGIVYGLLFGDDVTFVKNLLKTQKNFDISDIPKFSGKKRSYKYVKPINGGPVGPKQTRCLVDEEIEHMDFNGYCLVVQLTESPDVPSGNSFKVKTKIYLSWAPNNATKLFAVTSFVWTGKSWIKGAIEKGGISGQKEALGMMVSELKKKIASGGKLTASPSKNKKKDKGKKSKEEVEDEEEEEELQVEEVSEPEPPKTFMDLFMDQLDVKFLLIVVLFIIVICDKFSSGKKSTGYELYSNERMLMSESKLWEWIEQREKTANNKILPSNSNVNTRNSFREPLNYAAKKKMSQQELMGTIEMMEGELDALKAKAHQYEKLL